jgi:hypothetical protein
LLRPQPFVLREVERLGKHRRVVAAIILPPRRRPIGQRLRCNEILPSHLDGVHVDGLGDQVHHPLDDVGRRVLAIAAVRTHGHLVGIDPVGGPGHVLDPVDPRGAGGRQPTHHGVGAAITVGAQVSVEAHPQAA